MNKKSLIFTIIFLMNLLVCNAAYPYQYHPAEDTIGGTFGPGDFYFNNTMMVNATTRNVGIGTVSPSQKLHVVGSANFTGNVSVLGGSYLNGSVGIGTVSPSQKLHVVGNANIEGNVSVLDNSFLNGNVGIGTNNPSQKLDVNGSIYSSGGINTTSSVYASNWFRSIGASGWYSQTYGGGMWMTDSNYVRIYGSKGFIVNNGAVMYDGSSGSTPTSGAGTRFMWIPAKGAIRAGIVTGDQWDDGNVGPGSAAFGYNNKASNLYSAVSGGYSNTASNIYSAVSGGSSNIASGQYSTVAGGLSNTVSGDYSFAVGGNMVVTGSRTFVMGIDTVAFTEAGNDVFEFVNKINNPTLYLRGTLGRVCSVTPQNGNQWVCTSDARLKKNINDTKPILNDLMKIRIRDFAFIGTDENFTGVIAQELLEIRPDLVSIDNNSGYYMVKPISTWELVKGMQEQQVMIDEQNQKIDDQQSELDALKSIVCKDHPTEKICLK